MRDVKLIISDLRKSNVRLLLKGEDLEVIPAKGSLTDEMMGEIRSNKDSIVEYLRRNLNSSAFSRIKPVNEGNHYILSSSQRRLLLLSQFEGGNSAYIIPRIYVFDGLLDISAVEQAFHALIERHEIVRTVFKEDEKGEIRQFINLPEETGFVIRHIDLRMVKEQQKELLKLAEVEFAKPFDFSKGPLLRACLFRIEDNKWVFTYAMHHIISDGWSMDILIKELFHFYHAFTSGEMHHLKPLTIQYKDYATWQQGELSGTGLKVHQDYWLKQFGGELPVLDLQGDKTRPPLKTYKGEAIRRKINTDLCSGIKALGQQQGATLFMGILASVVTLLYRHTRQEDIIIGTPVAGRSHIDLEDQMGFYTNTLALRNRFNGNDSFIELLEKIRKTTLGAYEHQLYPFDQLVEELKLQRDTSRHPLFDVQVIVQSVETKNKKQQLHQDTSNLTISGYEGMEAVSSVFDIVFSFMETEDGLYLSIIYNNDIYNKGTINKFADHLEQLIKEIIENPDCPINRLDFLTEEEKALQLSVFNAKTIEFYPNKTLVDLFVEQTENLPDKLAVIFEDKKFTYRQLNEKSNDLAIYLVKNYAIRADDCIGVMLNRSEKTIITILAILKAGAAYVPIDPAYPSERKNFIINDAGIKLLITESEYIFNLDYYEHQVFAIDIQLDTIKSESEDFKSLANSRSLAYVVYTSGSTGQPKGVMIEHFGVANSIQAQQEILNLTPAEKCLQLLSTSFDASIFEIFITITTGAALYIINEECKQNPLLLERFIVENEITFISVSPAYLKLLPVEKLYTLKKVLTGGEAISQEKANAILEFANYYNAYGPTESSICVSIWECKKREKIKPKNIPIGIPIANVQLYILDDNLNLLPRGAVGEIYIGGAGLARGYLNNPELTAEKFISNPFRKGEKMYKTGDLAKWLQDGNIEFAGRIDEQVKINGYRIETGEIQTVLQAHPDIGSAFVVVRSNSSGQRELIAYITGRKGIDAIAIRSYLNKILPPYMVPVYFVNVEEFPLTSNGKIDRNKLPDPEELIGELYAYVAPRNETEKRLVKIWEEALDKEKIGIRDDFFELGGSSLKAMIILKKMTESGISLSIQTLFAEKTIENIANHIVAASTETTISRPDAPGNGFLADASYNQLMYFSEWKTGNDLVVSAYEFSHMDINVFRSAVEKLIERHEILRTVFVTVNGSVKQKTVPFEKLNITIDEPILIDNDNEIDKIIESEHNKEFRLDIFPLFSIKVYTNKGGKYSILVTMHHIITDGYSAGIILEDLTQIYFAISNNTASSIKPLQYQYKDFSAWQNNFVNSSEGRKQKEYWLNKLEGFQPVKYEEEEYNDNIDNSASLVRIIDNTLYEEINGFARQNGLTRPILLMGVLAVFCNQVTSAEDVAFSVAVSGRNSKHHGELDMKRMIGLVANALMVRNTINKDKPSIDYLRDIQANFLDDLNHETYPFQKLLTELPGITPSFLNNTGFFNYHNYNYYKESLYPVTEAERAGVLKNTGPQQRAFGLIVKEYRNCLHLELRIGRRMLLNIQADEINDLFFSILRQLINSSQLTIHEIQSAVID